MCRLPDLKVQMNPKNWGHMYIYICIYHIYIYVYIIYIYMYIYIVISPIQYMDHYPSSGSFSPSGDLVLEQPRMKADIYSLGQMMLGRPFPRGSKYSCEIQSVLWIAGQYVTGWT